MQPLPKNVLVAVPGAADDACYNLMVYPGYTVKDLKKQLPQLSQSSFFRSHNSLPCKETIDLYPSVRDGDMIFAAAYQDVGFIKKLAGLFKGKSSKSKDLRYNVVEKPVRPPKPRQSKVTRPVTSAVPSSKEPKGKRGLPSFQPIRPASPPAGEPESSVQDPSPLKGTPLWQRLGWTRDGNSYQGIYRFRHDGKWPGLIIKKWSGFDVFIWMPPAALQNHSHWACFNHVGKNKYKVHFIHHITEVSQAIINVQRLLAEAIIFCGKEARSA